MNSSCPLCGLGFECGAAHPDQPCWCVALPALPAAALGQKGSSCFCPTCLREQCLEQERQNGLQPRLAEGA